MEPRASHMLGKICPTNEPPPELHLTVLSLYFCNATSERPVLPDFFHMISKCENSLGPGLEPLSLFIYTLFPPGLNVSLLI
jgi:hypothetical protein